MCSICGGATSNCQSTAMSYRDVIHYVVLGAVKHRVLSDLAFAILTCLLLRLARRMARWACFRDRLTWAEWEDLVFRILTHESNRLPNLQRNLDLGEVTFASNGKARRYLGLLLQSEARDYLRKRDRVRLQALHGNEPQQEPAPPEEPAFDLEALEAKVNALGAQAAKDASRADKRRNILVYLPMIWELKREETTIRKLARKLKCKEAALYKRCSRVREALGEALQRRIDAYTPKEAALLQRAIEHLALRQPGKKATG